MNNFSFMAQNSWGRKMSWLLKTKEKFYIIAQPLHYWLLWALKSLSKWSTTAFHDSRWEHPLLMFSNGIVDSENVLKWFSWSETRRKMAHLKGVFPSQTFSLRKLWKHRWRSCSTVHFLFYKRRHKRAPIKMDL